MSIWRIFVLLALFLLLQSSVIPLLGLPLARPDLLLLLTLYVGLNARVEKSTLTGFFAGIAQDAFSVEVPGLNSFAKSLIGFLSPTVRRSFMVTNLFVQLLAVAGLTAVHAMIIYWMTEAISQKVHEIGAGQFFVETVWPQIVSHWIFWVLLRPLLRRFLAVEEDR